MGEVVRGLGLVVSLVLVVLGQVVGGLAIRVAVVVRPVVLVFVFVGEVVDDDVVEVVKAFCGIGLLVGVRGRGPGEPLPRLLRPARVQQGVRIRIEQPGRPGLLVRSLSSGSCRTTTAASVSPWSRRMPDSTMRSSTSVARSSLNRADSAITPRARSIRPRARSSPPSAAGNWSGP